METEVQNKMLSDADLIERVDANLRQFLSFGMWRSLGEAVNYAVFSGGKRIRPVLCLRTCQAVGGDIEDALDAAGAIELIHAFSLVHDDLPAMDDDDYRRGRPTLHRHTNEAMAILAGDAMTVQAFRLLAASDKHPDVSIRLVQILSGMSLEMILGQVHDTMGDLPEEMEDLERLRYIHNHKTGALIWASVEMGAVVGGATKSQRDALVEYAGRLGLMFQAVDDLLDVTQSAEKMGKATGKDAEQGKLTYPGLLGVDGTRAEIDKLLTQAMEALSGFDAKADPLRDMAKKLATREK
ncbi:MAG: polyprenyl synthetase family protein [Planctomycetota bacterium]